MYIRWADKEETVLELDCQGEWLFHEPLFLYDFNKNSFILFDKIQVIVEFVYLLEKLSIMMEEL